MDDALPVIAVVGAGRVGSLLGRAAARADCPISAVFSRTPAAAERLAAELGARAVNSLADAVAGADLVLLAVPDGTIASIAQDLALIDSGAAVVHTSGFHSADTLHAVEDTRPIGGLHPAVAIPTVEEAPALLEGVVFAVESNHPRLTRWLYRLVDHWKGIPVAIRPDSKAMYHAALSIASNFTVVLFAMAERVLERVGLDRESARRALLPLLRSTADNLARLPPAQALTGPLAREDLSTVDGHLAALHAAGEDLTIYLALARAALPLLAERGLETAAVDTLLKQWERQWRD